MWLGLELYSRNNEESEPADENSLIRFYDEYRKLRFVIASEAIMFIRSEDNYVQIHYLDKDKTKKFILRSSMRALEDSLSKHGLVRCHRSYFINPSFIRIVHRDTSGIIVADLNQEGYDSIPISRKYQDIITKLL
jgi:DNA-binding LytR/AlgR family response regulator